MSFELGEGEGTVVDVAGGGTVEEGGFDVFAVYFGGEFVGDGDFGKWFVFGERTPRGETGGGDGLEGACGAG